MVGISKPESDTEETIVSTATGFMIVPGILVTAAHFCKLKTDSEEIIFERYEAIRCPEIGQSMEHIELIAKDHARDIALFRIGKPRSTSCVQIDCSRIPIGTSCGILGFPLASVYFPKTGYEFDPIERFRGASIAAYEAFQDPSDRTIQTYEIDSFLYPGASGCPDFLVDARVLGMCVLSKVDPHPKPETTPQAIAISILISAENIREFAECNGIHV